MDDRIAAVIVPRDQRAPHGAAGVVIASPAFRALAALVAGPREVPLPRLDRVADGKARLMAMAEARRGGLVPVRVGI